MKQIWKKLTSRKFLLAASCMIAGIAALCGADETVVGVISGAVMTVFPAVVYCIMEGKIDQASVKQATESAADVAQALGADEAIKRLIEAVGEVLSSFDKGE